MITIRMDPTDRPFDVDSVIANIQKAFAGTTVIAEDSFQAQRDKAMATMRKLAREGNPTARPDAILDSIRNREAALGPGKDLRIPMGSGSLIGHVWVRDVVFRSEGSISRHIADVVISFLKSLQIGIVNVYEVNDGDSN